MARALPTVANGNADHLESHAAMEDLEGLVATAARSQAGELVLLPQWFRVRLDARERRFLLLCAGMFSLMTLSCYFEEWIFKALPGFDFYWTVAFVELLVFALSAGAKRTVMRVRRALQGSDGSDVLEKLQSGSGLAAPLWLYAAAAVALAMNQSVGKLLFRYLNYSTGMVLKSMKLVPTIVLSALWLRRQHKLWEWLASLLLVTSAGMMVMGEASSNLEFNPVGLLFAMGNLALASLQALLQDKALREYDAPISECLLYTNVMGACVVLGIMACIGELGPAFAFFANSPLAFVLLVVRSLTFLTGTIAYTALIKEFGAVPATAAGTARKIVSVLASFVFFPKPYRLEYVFGVAAFCAADLVYLRGTANKGRPDGMS